MAPNRCSPPAADVPPRGSRAAVTPRDNTWEQGTRAHGGPPSPAHPMLAVRDGAGWQAGRGRGAPPLCLLLPADRAVLPRKVRLVKIERGHGMAGGREAPDPSGTQRGRGSSEGTVFWGPQPRGLACSRWGVSGWHHPG